MTARLMLFVSSVALAACAAGGAAPVAATTTGAAEPLPRRAAMLPRSAAMLPRGAAMRAVLEEHNALRRKHCAPPLTWSPVLADSAQRWADHLASSGCGLVHSDGRYGENLAAGTAGTLTPTGVVRMWYRERTGYDFHRGGFSERTGHFTQLVWQATRRVGCGRSACRGFDLWVCEYDPPGNVQGEYRQNVLPASCRR